MRNILIVISGPSGSGKSVLSDIIIKDLNIYKNISYTTREPRQFELENNEYHFITKQQFIQKINNNEFIEYSEHFDNYYGTLKSDIENKLKTNDVLLVIDVNGGEQIKNIFNDAILIMIMPPSIEELKKRLINRHTETEEMIKIRLSRIDYEISKQGIYKYIVINDNINDAVQKIKDIINKEKQLC